LDDEDIFEGPVPYAGIARIRFDGLADHASQPGTGTPTVMTMVRKAAANRKVSNLGCALFNRSPLIRLKP